MSNSSKQRPGVLLFFFALAVALGPAYAQPVDPSKGMDSRVDYESLKAYGPWDDRNYEITQDDLRYLAPNEKNLRVQVPAFFRIKMRQALPEMQRTGPAQYPRSALQIFRQIYDGYLVNGKVYNQAEYSEGSYEVLMRDGIDAGDLVVQKFLNGEVRVTAPNGAAESAIKVNPVNTDVVIAGSNGPGAGQIMHFSTDGGENWTQTGLPLGGTCCDPTVDWSADGSLAYAATLGNCNFAGCQIWFYRSSDGGQTWTDLPGTPRRTLNTGSGNDKEFIHVDKWAASPFTDNIYATWHANNILQFARSTDNGESWSNIAFSSANDQRGIGSDITTDQAGTVYYFWPAFNSQRILLRRSTNGGASLGAVTEVAPTEASFTFPVPSIETRDVFVYVSADTDFSSGPFSGSIYAAWTDSTAATGNNAANNHARIQVAYSRDAGNTWALSTPHETADALSVDRWHQWLAVGADGTVHIVFYDTRRDPSRTSVDLFYSFSTDGAQSWSTPSRVTAQQSPNIGDSFEFGDYNGLDIVLDDLIAIYTDNRNESGGGADSVDVYAAGIPVAGGGGGVVQAANLISDEVIRTVNLSGLTNPIVVMGPPGFAGSQAVTVRGRNATTTSFQHNLQEWDYLDGNHAVEDMGYLAIEAGPSTLGGLAADAGTVDINHNWTTVSFAQSFSAVPVVVAQVMTNNGSQAVTTRIRNVNANTFQVRLQEEEGNDGTHAIETVHYIAVQVGSGNIAGRSILVGRTGNSVTHEWFTQTLSPSVGSPVLLADMQTFDGGDPAALRHRNLGASSFQIKVEEEQSANTEVRHTTEDVGYIVLGN